MSKKKTKKPVKRAKPTPKKKAGAKRPAKRAPAAAPRKLPKAPAKPSARLAAPGGSVVLLTIDTLRADVLGCYGGSGGHSPFIDSLRDKCILFERCQAAGPYTQASFPGILTSSFYLDHDDHGKGKVLSTNRLLVSEPIRKAGITTAAFHSNPYLCGLFGWNRGWNVFYDSMDDDVSDEVPFIQAEVINRKVDQWLGAQAAGGGGKKPFFLWAHYMDMHEPYVPSREDVAAVDPGIAIGSQEMFGLFKNTLLPRDVSNPQTVQLLRKLYLANLRKVDRCVREFFAILRRRGVLDDATVIVTADHGDEFGEHGGLSHDGRTYEELLHVPLLVYREDRKSGETCRKLVSGADIPPTVLDLLGLPAEGRFQGRGLLPVADYPEKGCFSEAIGKKGRQKDTDRGVWCYREGDLKISHRAETGEWELYDLAADPAERRNVFAVSPRAGEMKEKLTPRLARQ